MKRISFSSSNNDEFAKTVKTRVSEFLKENQINKFGGSKMIVKSIVMLFLFLSPLGILIFASISNPLLILTLYIISGFGMAGVGINIMHDANHGSFSRYSWLNTLMAYMTNLIGSNKEIWKLQHNVLHHGYTNIENYDDDINGPFFLRFSPHTKRHKINRYQHIYAWFFYGLITITWLTNKDFNSLSKFRELGLIQDRKTYRKYLFNTILWKMIFFLLTLVFPIIYSPVSAWITVLCFLAMQFLTGIIISLVFQFAHVMPTTEFPLPNEEGQIETDIMIHQLLTTSNYSQNNRAIYWCLGGLTNQIEHHLFPHISHVHYKKIAPIVKQSSEEFGLPYNNSGNFWATIKTHYKMLKSLGNRETTIKSLSQR